MTGVIVQRYRRRERLSHGVLLASLAVATLAAGVLSLSVGPSGVGWHALLAFLSGREAANHEAAALIIWQIRLPRALLAILVGAALGLSGSVLQGYLRNPLAEPGLIGVAPGASLGAALTIASGAAQHFALALPVAGLAGALVAALLVLGLAGARGGSVTLILAGIAVTSFVGALTALTVNLSPNPFAAIEIIFWMLGSLADRSMDHVTLAAPFILPGLAIMAACGKQLDALSLGEEVATNIGVDLRTLRLQILLGSALAVGAATAIAGTVGFVGLIVPHLLRRATAQRPARLLVPSMLGGAVLVLLADTAARLPFGDSELNLGVVTALVGAPLFFHLVWQSRRGGGL